LLDNHINNKEIVLVGEKMTRYAPNKVAFLLCTEKGALEMKSLLMVESLRTWGGRLANSHVYSFAPRFEMRPSSQTIKELESMKVKSIDKVLNEKYINYPLANKPLVCAWAEENLEYDILVFVDSDMMFFNEPAELVLRDDCDVAVRPVDKKRIGSDGVSDCNSTYWRELYEICDVKVKNYITTTVEQSHILSYWNSGLIAVRREKKIFQAWRDNFINVMSNGLSPLDGPFFIEQSVFAATLSAITSRVWILSPNYNYPINIPASETPGRRYRSLGSITSIHYHKMFEVDLSSAILTLQNELYTDCERFKWLMTKISNSPTTFLRNCSAKGFLSHVFGKLNAAMKERAYSSK